jgi:hypothetical protein
LGEKEDNWFVDFKPLNVQFEIEDEQTVDEVLDLATQVAKRRGDRRLRAANIAKEIFLRVWKEHPEIVHEFFNSDTGALPVAAEQRAAYGAHPKERKRATGG